MAEEREPEIGDLIGSCRLVREIGKGGMATVYEGLNESINKRVAIKVLHARFHHNREIVVRFLHEARSVNTVSHVGLVNIFAFGKTPEGYPYIVMEHLIGQTLRQYLKAAPIQPVVRSLRLARQLSSALTATHALGIIHRDLKPGNVMVVKDPEAPGGERAKIFDFGIAKQAASMTDSQGGEFQTGMGMLLGTPGYMAPEQYLGASEASDRVDVFSLGVILYELLTGTRPYPSTSMLELQRQMLEPPLALRKRNPGVPDEVAGLVMAMLSREPEGRPSMAQVEAELLRFGAKMTDTELRAVPSPAREEPSTPYAAIAAEKFRVGRYRWLIGLSLMIMLLVGVGITVILHGRRPDINSAPLSSMPDQAPGAPADKPRAVPTDLWASSPDLRVSSQAPPDLGTPRHRRSHSHSTDNDEINNDEIPFPKVR